MKDLKESLSSGRKPDITHVRKATMVYIGRGCEYGDKRKGGKYVRGNYRRPAEDNTPRGNFLRYREYLRAMLSHTADILDLMELHEAMDPDLQDVEGMKRAMYAEDTDALPDCPVGPSGLPHLAAALASGNMALTQAVDCGMLPKDPGQPWRQRSQVMPEWVTVYTTRPELFLGVEFVPEDVFLDTGDRGFWFSTNGTDAEAFTVHKNAILHKSGYGVFVKAGTPLHRATTAPKQEDLWVYLETAESKEGVLGSLLERWWAYKGSFNFSEMTRFRVRLSDIASNDVACKEVRLREGAQIEWCDS